MYELDKKTKTRIAVGFLAPLIFVTIGLTALGFNINRIHDMQLREKGEIVILCDKDFTTRYNFSGDGTKTNPYLIENLVLNTPGLLGIIIQDTSEHFLIRNCTISKNGFSIYIVNAAFGTARIENNTCFFEPRYYIKYHYVYNIFSYKYWSDYFMGSITIENSPASIIKNNTCIKNGETYDYSDDFSVYHNYVYFEELVWERYKGITIANSDFSIITSNLIKNYLIGINVESNIFILNINDNFFHNNILALYSNSDYSSINNNTFSGNKYGLYLSGERNLVSNNYLFNSTRLGMILEVSINSTITNNFFNLNTYGLAIYDSMDTIITFNQFMNSTYYGCVIKSYDGWNFIYNNNFLYNNFENTTYGSSQAFESNTNNLTLTYWYDRNNFKGNYWSNIDWTSDCYIIDGKNSTDIYPLLNPVEIGDEIYD